MSYIELHSCSAFSFLRGGSFPEQIAETAAELEMPAVALLDRNGVYGTQRFSVAAREHGVRPIVGSELYVWDGVILPVLVQNRTGYTNLCQLLTQAHLRSEKGNCSVEWNELPEFTERFGGTLRIGERMSGERRRLACRLRRPRRKPFGSFRFGEAPLHGAPRNSADHAQFLIDIFGRDNVYVEIQRHFIRGEDKRNAALIDLARYLRLWLLAT